MSLRPRIRSPRRTRIGDAALAPLAPGQAVEAADRRFRPVERQAPGERVAASRALSLLVWRQGLRGERDGVDRVVAMRGTGDGPEHLASRAEAAVEHAQLAQALERRCVGGPARRLAQDGRLPVQPQPGQVLVDGRLEGGAAAGEVGVLDAKEEAPARLPRGGPGGQGGKRVAAVQAAGRARGEAGDEGGRAQQSGCPWKLITASKKSVSPPSASLSGLNWSKPAISARPWALVQAEMAASLSRTGIVVAGDPGFDDGVLQQV
jgi:hypothetical protein